MSCTWVTPSGDRLTGRDRWRGLAASFLLVLSPACVGPEPPVTTQDGAVGGGDGTDAAVDAAPPIQNDAGGDRDVGAGDRAEADAGSPDLAAGTDAAPGGDTAPGADIYRVDECPAPFARCTGHAGREACEETAAGLRRIQEECPDGSACVGGECVVGSCADECGLHEEGCYLYSMDSDGEVALDPSGSTADRAREFRAHIGGEVLPNGGICGVWYTDDSLTMPRGIHNTGDSAEFTGVYAMAESFRYMLTRSPDAARALEQVVQSLAMRFRVTGSPGYMARYVEDLEDPPELGAYWNCDTDPAHHCDWEHEGRRYSWSGSTSRDMYAGAMTGLGVAYDALDDGPLRDRVREILVTVVEELMIERTLPVLFIVDGAEIPFTLTSRYVIPNPAEMVEERVIIGVDTGDVEDSAALQGVREFVPDMADIFRQLRILSWLPNIPRGGTCIMLGDFFGAALNATEGVPAYASRRQAIANFYAQNFESWLATAQDWSYDRDCGNKYYASNIAFVPAYGFAHFEDDPARGPQVREALLPDVMWPGVSNHKNPWFAFIVAAHMASPLPEMLAVGREQTTLFAPHPRRRVQVDLSDHYPVDEDCTAEHGYKIAHEDHAVDCDERPVAGFQWERHPWRLEHPSPDPLLVSAGGDYLGVYWMGRYHGFMEDDRPGVCTRRR